ncbi:hypothetical protein T484DRAFT_2082860 [Baffinella frigidus]|nr:hypothetical protein T484DRAFT_2082860 [Cryptophyta sp. CCMP2293]
MDQVYGAFLSLLWVAFGEVNLMGPYALARSGDWVQLLMVTYVLIQALLLLNLLIAMMLQTFTASTSDVYKTWIFPFAALVLRYEEMLPRDQRSKPHYRCGDPEIVLTNESTASKDEGDQDASALSKDPLGLQAKGTPAPWPSLLSVLRNPFVHIFELGFGQGHKSSDDELMERMYAQWNCCPFYEMRVENLPITEEAMEDEAAKEQLRLVCPLPKPETRNPKPETSIKNRFDAVITVAVFVSAQRRWPMDKPIVGS